MTRVQDNGVKLSLASELLKSTVPAGVLFAPLGSVSLTVAVHVLDAPAKTVLGVQATTVVVIRVPCGRAACGNANTVTSNAHSSLRLQR